MSPRASHTRAYQCFGLHIVSDIELPELTSVNVLPDSLPSTAVSIRLIAHLPSMPSNMRTIDAYVRSSRDQLLMHIPGVAMYFISHGNDIAICPEPDADDLSIRLYLLGSAFGALLLQRDELTLHGNAIRIGDACLICVGASGAGKSTLAAEFARRGYTVMADDLVPVNNKLEAVPGIPRIKLWKDAVERLALDARGLTRIRHEMDKYHVPLASPAAPHPAKVNWIVEITRAPDARLDVHRSQGRQKLPVIIRHLYRPSLASAMTRTISPLARVQVLAGAADVISVTRSDHTDTVRELCSLLSDIITSQ